MLEESMSSLMCHDDGRQKHQHDHQNISYDSILSLLTTDEEEMPEMLLQDPSKYELPALVEHELLVPEEKELQTVNHVEDDDEKAEDADVVTSGSPIERERSSMLSSLRGSIRGSPRATRVKSAHAASLNQRMQDVSSSSANSNDTTYSVEEEEQGGGVTGDQEMREISTSSQGRRFSSRRTPSRSRTSHDPHATMEGLAGMKIPATGKACPTKSRSLSRSRTNYDPPSASMEGLAGIKLPATGKPGPSKGRPTRKKSSDFIGTKGSLRRNRTADSRITRQTSSNSNALGRMSRMLRGPPSRNNSVALNSGIDNNKDTTSGRRTPTARSSLPMRVITKSFSDQLKRRTLPASSNSRPKAVSRTSLNIFGSDLVSTGFILNQLEELDKNHDIIKVELEDCLVTRRAMAIPLRLKEIVAGDKTTLMRPWEGIHFVDELFLSSLDGAAVYKDFKRNRRHFIKALDGVYAQQVIPLSQQVKVHLTHQDDNDATDDEKDSSSTMVALLQQFQKDVAVTTINVTTRKASLELVQALTLLLQCDDRPWDTTMLLELSYADGVESKEVATLGGLEQWHAAMQDATEQLKKTMEAKGLAMPN
jgi:hypothetical protein